MHTLIFTCAIVARLLQDCLKILRRIVARLLVLSQIQYITLWRHYDINGLINKKPLDLKTVIKLFIRTLKA